MQRVSRLLIRMSRIIRDYLISSTHQEMSFFLYKNEKKRKNIRHYTSVRSRIQKTLTANQQGTNTYLTLKIIPQMGKKNWRENGIHAATWCNKDRDKS
jgi:hypothetical protein